MKSMGQAPPIMSDVEFEEYMKDLKKKVERWLLEIRNYDIIRILIMGHLQGSYTHSFTPDQLGKAFDLGFLTEEGEDGTKDEERI